MNSILRFLIEIANALIRVRGVFAGFEKENGVRTDKPLIDAATGKRVYWLALTIFPVGSIGGEDIELFAKCLSDDMPININSGERPLVELLNPTIELAERGFSLVCEGVTAIKEPKAGGK